MANEFTVMRRVEFSETDMAGVLHFANYYRYMEEVEHAYWRSVGLSVITDVDGQEITWPRVATSCEYFAPARFEDELELSLVVEKVGNRSVTHAVEFRCKGRRIALGRITAACCMMDEHGFHPVSIPEVLRQKLLEPSEVK